MHVITYNPLPVSSKFISDFLIKIKLRHKKYQKELDDKKHLDDSKAKPFTFKFFLNSTPEVHLQNLRWPWKVRIVNIIYQYSPPPTSLVAAPITEEIILENILEEDWEAHQEEIERLIEAQKI